MLSFALDRPDRDAVPDRPHPEVPRKTVAKRTRGVGVRNTYRPGGGPPVRPATPRSGMGKAAEPPAAIPGEPLRPGEVDPVAAAIAGTAAVSSSTAVVHAPGTAPVHSHQRGRVKVKEGSLLASRAEDEYAYIAKDLRQIAIVAAILFGALIAIWLFLTQVDPFGLY